MDQRQVLLEYFIICTASGCHDCMQILRQTSGDKHYNTQIRNYTLPAALQGCTCVACCPGNYAVELSLRDLLERYHPIVIRLPVCDL